MSVETIDLAGYCLEVAQSAKRASRVLATSKGEQRNTALHRLAQLLRSETDRLQAANAKDIEAAPSFGLTAAATDRLRLTDKRLEQMAAAVDEIAAATDPVGEVISGSVRPNGLELRKVRVPLGVVFFVYESRPNVTTDAAALCLKSGNAVILRGGKEARHSNLALGELVGQALAETGLPAAAVRMVEVPDRAAVREFLQLSGFIDVAIPRGGESLIRSMVADATMPVLKHYLGNCHVYVDAAADEPTAVAIVENAKCQRPGVCNAAETLLVHAAAAPQLLPPIAARLLERGVELRGCERTRELVPAAAAATDEDYATEFLDLILAVRVVDDLEAAIQHIARFGSGHTEAIVTRDFAAAQRFASAVDSSAVMVNASTRFNDGGQFGLGAEIGISTDKFHARGPCGLAELTSYKYIVVGQGHVREA